MFLKMQTFVVNKQYDGETLSKVLEENFKTFNLVETVIILDNAVVNPRNIAEVRVKEGQEVTVALVMLGG